MFLLKQVLHAVSHCAPPQNYNMIKYILNKGLFTYLFFYILFLEIVSYYEQKANHLFQSNQNSKYDCGIFPLNKQTWLELQ